MKKKVTKLLRLAGVKAGGCKKAIKRAMVKSLTFSQWTKVMKKTPPKSKSRMAAMNAMLSCAKTAEQWLVIFENSPAGSLYAEKAYAKIEELEDFESWHDIFRKAKKNNRAIRKLALSKMDELCGKKNPENRAYFLVALHIYRQDKKIEKVLA